MEIKYKIYEVKKDDTTNAVTFIESELNWLGAFDTVEEACDRIRSRGYDYVHYTVLPDIMA